MTSEDTAPSDARGRRIKVVRLLNEYDLNDVGDIMVKRWTASGDERMSLRDLADYFNRRLLPSVMAAVGMQPLAGEVDVTGVPRTVSGATNEQAVGDPGVN